MFGTIRKHQQWLWILIVGAVILSFVVWFGPNQSLEGLFRSGGGFVGAMDGKPITKSQLNHASRLWQTSRFFMGRNAPRTDNDQTREILTFLLLEDRIKQAGIAISDDVVATWIRENLTDRQTQKNNYDEIIAAAKNQRIAEADILDFIRHNIAREHLSRVAGVSGSFVTPREATAELQRTLEEVVVNAVSLSTSNYLGAVKIEPAALQQFYTNTLANYRTPARMQVSYLRFAISNYVAEAAKRIQEIPNLTNELEQIYTQRGQDAFKDTEGKPLTKDAAIARLRSDQEKLLATGLARNRALEIYNMISEAELKREQWADFAKTNQLAPVLSAPFASFGFVDSATDARNFAQECFKLDAENWYGEPVVGDSAVYLATFHTNIPSTPMPFDQVRARVTEDYKRSKAGEALRAAGSTLHAAITNGIRQGKSFAAIAAEQGQKAAELPPFSLSTPSLAGDASKFELSTLKNQAFALKPGEVSDFQVTRDGGVIIQLKEKRPVDDAKLKAQVPQRIAALQKDREPRAFFDWLNGEIDKAGLRAQMEKASADSAPPSPQ